MQVWRVIPDSADPRRGRVVGPSIDIPCALGRAGVVGAAEKREGDGKTPTGTSPFRQAFFSADKITPPKSVLTATPISTALGWCDDPMDAHYNQLVQLPYAARHEKMWRDDNLYDVVLVIGHNDAPPAPNLGSAIFVHVAKQSFLPTEGCVALERADLVTLLSLIKAGDALQIG